MPSNQMTAPRVGRLPPRLRVAVWQWVAIQYLSNPPPPPPNPGPYTVPCPHFSHPILQDDRCANRTPESKPPPNELVKCVGRRSLLKPGKLETTRGVGRALTERRLAGYGFTTGGGERMGQRPYIGQGEGALILKRGGLRGIGGGGRGNFIHYLYIMCWGRDQCKKK